MNPTAMLKHSPSVITRLLIGYVLLVAASFIALAAVFYIGTIGVLNRSIDRKVVSISAVLAAEFQASGRARLASSINDEISDGMDSDSEIFFAVSGAGTVIAGNLGSLPRIGAYERLTTGDVVRNGGVHRARLLAHRLADGGVLIVGRDLREQESIRTMVWEALAAGAAAALALGIAGALLFRNQINRRIGDIRLAAAAIEGGDLSRRIPVAGNDEFGLLNRDINRMLDRIEQLMDGIRHVSNAIAHDLRTPLGRIRGQLDDALRRAPTSASLADAAHGAIADIDELTQLFEKLLYIAEAESGMRDRQFAAIDLSQIALDMVELYDATAEQYQASLRNATLQPAPANGDRNLLGSAVASLIDNAIKHTGPGTIILVSTYTANAMATIEVRDDGPGIPIEELARVTERFYRLDRSRSSPGNGLGLSIVAAIVTLHRGTLTLHRDAGLIAKISLPAADHRVPEAVHPS
jgi:signal transduction histidine kinase